MISEITDDGRIYAQYCSDGPAVEKMMDNIVQEFTTSPPLGGAYTPKKGNFFINFVLFFNLELKMWILK